MNADKLSKLTDQVRIGGKGTVRRKKKVVHRNATDDKKLQGTLKKLNVNPIPGIEEVNMFKKDGQMIQFNNPKVQASLGSNTFAISGPSETKSIMPSFLNHLKPSQLDQLKSLLSESSAAAAAAAAAGSSDAAASTSTADVPEVASFDEPAKAEA